MAFQPARPQVSDFGGSFQKGMASAISAVQGNKDRAQKERQANRAHAIALEGLKMQQTRFAWDEKENQRAEEARNAKKYINKLEVEMGPGSSDQSAFVFDKNTGEMGFNSGLFGSMNFLPRNKKEMQNAFINDSDSNINHVDKFNTWFDTQSKIERDRTAAKIINGIDSNFSEGEKKKYSRLLLGNPEFKSYMNSINGTEQFNSIAEKIDFQADKKWTWKRNVYDQWDVFDESTFLGAHAPIIGGALAAGTGYGTYKYISGAPARAEKKAAKTAATIAEEAAATSASPSGKYSSIEDAESALEKAQKKVNAIKGNKKADGKPYKNIHARDRALKAARLMRDETKGIVDNWSDDAAKATKKTSTKKTSNWKNITSGKAGRGYLPFRVGYEIGEKLTPGDNVMADTVGGAVGGLSMSKVMKKITSKEGMTAIKTVLKKSGAGRKILTKMGISAVGMAVPELASTVLGVAGTAWAAYDIIKLAAAMPELYSMLTD